MERITVAVGSTRKPKLDAMREALAIVGPNLIGASDAQFDVTGFEVPSGVRHTPLSRGDLMAGARQRAEALLEIARAKNQPWKFFAGLEGGLDVVRENGARLVFLESWAYIADASGRGAFGRSGAVMIPEPLAKRVVDDGVELSEAIDAFAGERGVRDAQGAWGVLTRNVITRQEAFQVAIISAFAPFFNGAMYERPDS